MKQLFQKWNVLKVLGIFFEDPRREFYLREIGRKAGVSASTAMRCLRLLERQGLVSYIRRKNGLYYAALRTPEFKALKVSATVSRICSIGVADLVKEKSAGLVSFLLFGSAAKGEDGLESDYDFVLIAAQSSVTSFDLADKLGREVNLKKFTISQWKEASRKNKAFYLDVLNNSICLIGEKPIV